MRLVKKLFFIFFLLIFYFNIYSIDYYICLGSFLDNNNAIEYSISLNEIGIKTIHEKAKIKNKYFTRVLLDTNFKNLKEAINELKKLLNNEVIKKEKIRDLWIRPGKLVNVQKVTKTKLSSNIKNKEINSNKDQIEKQEKKTIEKKLVETQKKEKENKIEGKSKLEKNSKENTLNDKLENKNESRETTAIKKTEQKQDENIILEKNKYKVISDEGYANCIFSSQPIELGKEENYKLKTVFNKPEKVFARCYFPNSIGKIENNNFWHEIWIDGKFIRKTVFNSSPDPSWDQIQIWISEDDYSDIINSLEKGEHKITIWILKNQVKIEGDKKEVVTVKLSKGEFTYIVP